METETGIEVRYVDDTVEADPPEENHGTVLNDITVQETTDTSGLVDELQAAITKLNSTVEQLKQYAQHATGEEKEEGE